MSSMKSYLMLDVDGVLNHSGSPRDLGLFAIDPRCVQHLNKIVVAVRPEIVISSTWRYNYDTKEMRELLAASGFKFPELVAGETAKIYGSMVPSVREPENQCRRGLEIVHWLEAFAQPPCGMVILDDSDDMWVVRDRLVRTSMQQGGLTAAHVEPTIAMLRKPLAELPDTVVGRLVLDEYTETKAPQAIRLKETDEPKGKPKAQECS